MRYSFLKYKSVFIFCLLFGIIGCAEKPEKNQVAETPKISEDSKDKPQNLQIAPDCIAIDFSIENLGTSNYALRVDFNLKGECYMVSPFSEDNILGKLAISVENSKYLELDNTLIETPKIESTYDPIIKQHARYVRGKVNYKKVFTVKTQENFKVNGKLWFVLEPICLPFEVDFRIQQINNKLLLENGALERAPLN